MGIIAWCFGVLRRLDVLVHFCSLVAFAAAMSGYIMPAHSRAHVMWYAIAAYVGILVETALASRGAVSSIVAFVLSALACAGLFVLLDWHAYRLTSIEITMALAGTYTASVFGYNDYAWRQVAGTGDSGESDVA